MLPKLHAADLSRKADRQVAQIGLVDSDKKETERSAQVAGRTRLRQPVSP